MQQDRERWDSRYAGNREAYPEADEFLVNNAHLLTGGRALEVACGLGANAIFLAQRNYWVDAVDISEHALRKLRHRSLQLEIELGLVVGDLDYFPIPERIYDLVVVFYFFSESLIAAISNSVKPGGHIVYCTYNYLHRSLKPDFRPQYLVPKGGLAQLFPGTRVIIDEPEAGPEMNLSRLIARKL
ncbi:MAG: class I SAM-dependent methyltransferase [Desulfomonilaceae bacterium]